jgi:cytochrome d ubiquinol oxidase subunit I
VDPLAAMFNPAWATETSHMVIAAYLATAFGVASVYAIGMLRGRRDSYHRHGLAVGLATAAIMAPLQLGVGDLLGRTVAHNQPAKLAAIEGQYPTERGAGLSLGSFPVPGHDHAVLNVKVPKLLSVLAFDDAHAKVRGLASFPKRDRTPLALPVRLSFLGMVGICSFLVALSLWYWLRIRGQPRPEDRWTLLAIVASGPLAFLANEFGWLVSEFGRQPWVIYGVLRTRDAVTTASGLDLTFTGFTLLYIGLAAATIWLLRRLATGAPAGLASPAQRMAG